MPQHPTDALEAEASRAQQQPSFYLVPDEEEEGASEGGSASGDDWVPTEEGAEDEAAEDEEEEYGARAAKRAKAAEARSRKPGKRKGGFVVDSDEEDEEEEEEEEEFEAEDEDSESDSGEGYAPAPPRKKKPQAPKPAPRAKARASAALEPQWTESRRAPPPRAATFRVRPNYAEASESEPEASASEPAWPARPRAASGGGARHAPPAPARLSRARGSRSDLRQTSDSESGSEAAGGSGAPRRPAPACLLPEEETAYLEEEIERVVGHREPPEDSADVLQRGGLALEDGLAPGADGKLGAGADGKLDAGADGKLGAGADGKLAAGADPEPSAPSSSRPFAPLTRPWSELEFRIKWARQSYRECTWRSHASLASSRGFKKVLNYAKRADERAAWARAATPEELELAGVSAAMEEELVGSYERVERVVAARWSLFEEEVEVGEEELPDPSSQPSSPACPSSSRAPQPHRQYLVKWQGLPYAEATWESATSLGQSAQDREAVEAYRQRRARESEARVSVTAARRAFAGTGKRALEAQPDCLRGGRLRDYQLQGLNWMTYCWSRDANAILADEMGLGKTVQCASLLGYLFEELRLAGPALVVVPLSVAANWAREFRTWTPQLNAVLYIGDAASRAVIRAFELRGVRDMGVRDPGVDWARVEERLSREDAAAAAPPDVLLTTYELALKDADLLRGVRWNYFMVDEAHRLKNEGSALYRELSSWRLANKLLITGTPLQNSLRELWALLTFLTPGAWGEPDAFAETYDAASPDAVARLHAALRPCLLRRVIREVERSLPPKTERVLKVGMTPLQKQYYRWILTRNFAELNKGARGGQVTLLNVIMDLKKCCNHPFLFESAEENYRRSGSDADTQVDVLARTSGKLALLDRLLARLKADGHRVLVFSQMVRMLDILADYCRLRGYSAQRLDGSTPAAARASAMERFNAPGSPDFIFLLSTRAGGLGINLATADTVVIFDSDWNPQNDLQAMSRAHRIGQKGAVAIYRFVTAATVEESILERAKSKMMLDDVVIQRMDTSGRTVLQPDKSKAAGGMFGKDELAAILRCGAAQLFGEGKDEGAKQEEAEEPRQGGLSQGGPTSQALVTEDDLDAILQRAEVLDEASRAQDLGSHMLDGFSNVSTFASEETDADFWKKLIPEEEQRKARQAAADEEEEPLVRTARLRALEALGADPGALTLGAKRKLFEEAGGRERLVNPPLPGCQVRIDFWPACSHSDDDPHPPTLSRRDAGAFARAVRRHLSPNRLDAIAEESGGKVRGCSAPALLRLYKELLRGCQEAADQVQARGGNAADARLDWFGSEVRCQELVALCSGMARLEAKLRQAESSGNAGGFALGPHEMPAPTQWMRGCGWGPSQDAALILGIHLHGLGHWERLAEDPTLGLGGFLAAAVAGGAEAEVPSLPKPSHLETRAQALLRQLDKVARREALPPRPRAASGRRGSGAGRGREASREPGKESRREPGKESRREPGRESRREPDRESRKEAVKDSRMEAAKAEASQPPRKTPAARPAAQLPGGSHGMTREQGVAVLGKECMTWVGKLRTLQRLGSEMPEQRLLLKSRKYLHAIGAGVRAACAGGEEDEARLWAFVSSYTGNSMDGAELAGVYKRLPAGSSEKEA